MGNIRLPTYIFLPQPKKLNLEITSLVSKNISKPLFTVQLTPPFLACLLEQAKVISRWPNKHQHSIIFRDVRRSTGHSNFKFLNIPWKLIFNFIEYPIPLLEVNKSLESKPYPLFSEFKVPLPRPYPWPKHVLGLKDRQTPWLTFYVHRQLVIPKHKSNLFPYYFKRLNA